MSRQLPTLSQWHWYPLTDRNLRHVPEVPGVYLLADPPPARPTVFYVGQTDYVAEELGHRLADPDADLARHVELGTRLFCYKAIHGGEAARLRAERRLIRRYQLGGNV
jgi:hypothetical protein